MDQFCDINNDSDRVDSFFHTVPLISTDCGLPDTLMDYGIQYTCLTFPALWFLWMVIAPRSWTRKILIFAKIYAVLILVSSCIIWLHTPETNLIYNSGKAVNKSIIREIRERNDTSMLMQWDPNPSLGRIGHVSLFVYDKYMSNWPAQGTYSQDSKYPRGPGVREPIYENEVTMEGGQPERVLIFPKGFLDESRAIAFWQEFRHKTHRYHRKESNCANFVHDILLNSSFVYDLAYSTSGSFIIDNLRGYFFFTEVGIEYPYNVFLHSSFAIEIFQSGWFWGHLSLFIENTKFICDLTFAFILLLPATCDAFMFLFKKNCALRGLTFAYSIIIYSSMLLIDQFLREGLFSDKFFNKYMTITLFAIPVSCIIYLIIPKAREARSDIIKMIKMDLYSLW